jgi:hypothetical protein
MMYGSDVGVICCIHELRKKFGWECQEYISAHCLLCLNQLFGVFLLDKSNMVNNIPEDDDFALIQCKLTMGIDHHHRVSRA